MAAVAVEEGTAERAAILWGAADAARESLNTEMESSERWIRERYEPRARSELGETLFVAAHGRGFAMSLDEAVDYALSGLSPEHTQPVVTS